MQEPLKNEKSENEVSRERDKKHWKKSFIFGLCALLCVGCAGIGYAMGKGVVDPEMRTLAKIKKEIQDEYYQEITDSQFYDTIFDAINEDLLDPYSYYLTADEYADKQESAKGKNSGIGLSFYSGEEMVIVKVSGNSPAEAAGLKVEEQIVGFGASQTQMVESSDFQAFSNFLAGYDTGETFYVTVKGADGTERAVSLAKAAYVENYVFYRSSTTSYRFTGAKATDLTAGGAPLSCLDERTAYIKLIQFNGSAATQFSKAMGQFKKENKKNLILDLRGNGGGYLDIMQKIASYFCKDADGENPIVAVADYGESKQTFRAYSNEYSAYFTADSRICVLADSQTASASECLIGCMYDYNAIEYEDICLFTRNGEAKTYGKGIMQETFSLGLTRKDAIKLTTATIHWPVSNTCIHGRGVLPQDGALTLPEGLLYDEALAGAVALLFDND